MTPWQALAERKRNALVSVLFIVNGEDVPIANDVADVTIGDLRDIALWRSRNFGRDFDDWDLRDTSGRIIDPRVRASDVRTHVFVTLAVGFGG